MRLLLGLQRPRSYEPGFTPRYLISYRRATNATAKNALLYILAELCAVDPQHPGGGRRGLDHQRRNLQVSVAIQRTFSRACERRGGAGSVGWPLFTAGLAGSAGCSVAAWITDLCSLFAHCASGALPRSG